MSLRNRLILILLLFSVIPVSTVILIEIKRDQKTLKDQIGIGSLEFARLTMKRICEYINSKQVDVQRWSKDNDFQSVEEGNNSVALNQHLVDLLKNYQGYAYINYLDTKGAIVASSNVEFIGDDMSLNIGFKNALNGKSTVQDVTFDEMSGEFALVISTPVMDISEHTEQSKVIGVIFTSLKWRKVNEIVAYLDIKGKKQNMANHIMLTNIDGLVISCFDPDQMFRTNLFDIGLKSFQYAHENREGYIIETTEHGLSSFSTYTYLKKDERLFNLNWYLIFYQDSESIFIPIHELKHTMLWILICTSIFLAITSFLFAKRISKPIIALALNAQAIGKGDLKKQIIINSKDEIGYLANSFNTMRQQLAESFRNVEIHRKELQRLSNRILSIQEEERKNLSRELHDQVGQSLVALKTNLEVIGRLIPIDAIKPHEWIKDSKVLILETMREMRSLSFRLRPTMLDELGLVPTIESYAKEFTTRTKITVEVNSNLKAKRFESDIELSLYRMVQEGLTNVIKHSEGSNVTINVDHENSKLTMCIQDNGKGFDTNKILKCGADERSVGLLGMRERFASINANFKVVSSEGQGTKLIAICHVPVG